MFGQCEKGQLCGKGLAYYHSDKKLHHKECTKKNTQ